MSNSFHMEPRANSSPASQVGRDHAGALSDATARSGKTSPTGIAPCRSPAKCYCIACRPELHARATDPGTSHQAASRATDIAVSHRNIIAAALRQAPATPKEIAAATGLEYHAVQRRMKELASPPLNVIETTGAIRDGCREWRHV